MTVDVALQRGRVAFDARSWEDAFACLAAADQASPLQPEDLETLATSAYLTGRYEPCTDLWARAHQQYVRRGADERAAGCAFWLAFTLVNRGDFARAGGWVSRGVELLEHGRIDCVQQGYLLMLTGIQALMQGDAERALPTILHGGRSPTASPTPTSRSCPGSATARRCSSSTGPTRQSRCSTVSWWR